MSAPAIRTRVRRLAGGLAVSALIACAATARATCPAPGPLTADTGYPILLPNHYNSISVSSPYWIAFGAITNDPTDDYDVSVYATGSGGTEPTCFSGLLASSTNLAGRTDFVVGDFNHNPFGTYYVWQHCYSGHCDSMPRGIRAWRAGATIGVNNPPITVDPNATFQSEVVNIYDVYLNSGTTYYFQFQTTGGLEMKMLLFANPGGGVYWAGRNGAALEASACTTYTAPASGYYGLVVVPDRRFSTASYTLGVTTAPVCNCPRWLVSGVPQTLPASEPDDHGVAVQTLPYWQAIGARSGGSADWDVSAWTTASPTIGCTQGLHANSAGLPPRADVVVGDFNKAPVPDSASIHFLRYSGAGGASIELDNGPDVRGSNGPRTLGSFGFDEVVRAWDVSLVKDTTYHFQLRNFSSNQKLLLFGNPTNGGYWAGRSEALFETADTMTFKPGYGGFFGMVLVKDDASFDTWDVSFGTCPTPAGLTSQLPRASAITSYTRFIQLDTTWAAGGVFHPSIDWDIAQFDSLSGGAWPDCFGGAGALSNGSGVMDFIVGDFHHQPVTTHYLRSYQFTPDVSGTAFTEWDAGRGTLVVNAPATSVTLASSSSGADRLFCYQTYLQSGIPYVFSFAHAGTADVKLVLFDNAGQGVYWAPRSAAVFAVTATQNYIAPHTGWYGVVVVKDNNGTGSFDVRVSSPVVAVEAAGPPARDALQGVSPNPVRGAARLRFALAHPASPAFEVLDLQGRVRARLVPGALRAGAWDVPLATTDAGGAPLAAGVYFVRMRVGDTVTDTRRFVVR